MSGSRQNAGLTRSKSPLYTFYPPDCSGRRPSAHTELQYNSPEDRRYAEQWSREISRQRNQSYQDGPSRGSGGAYYPAYPVQNSASQRQPTAASYQPSSQPSRQLVQVSAPHRNSQGTENRFPHPDGSSRYSSNEPPQGTIHRPESYLPPVVSDNGQPRGNARVWYCSEPGCPHPGPYLEALYSDCALGCHTRRR